MCCLEAREGSIPAHYKHSTVFINATPFDKLSSLIVPQPWLLEPQHLTQKSLVLALQIALNLRVPAKADSLIRIGYNSMGAGASVDHQHFQMWLPTPPNLPIEHTPTRLLQTTRTGLAISTTTSYPIPSIVFDYNSHSVSQIEDVARSIQECSEWMLRDCTVSDLRTPTRTNTTTTKSGEEGSFQQTQQLKISVEESSAYSIGCVPHNLLISNNRTFLVPRRKMIVFRGKITFGFPEVSGELILFDRPSYNHVSREELTLFMEHSIALAQPHFEKILKLCNFV
eukprot:c16796_g1_i1.p1 GENE.c16796_g1_i1~~c16796_g1_i1.p1  ORF type:complete len:302 (+),score=77.46 c16796_g1_i1:58-906(+)